MKSIIPSLLRKNGFSSINKCSDCCYRASSSTIFNIKITEYDNGKFGIYVYTYGDPFDKLYYREYDIKDIENGVKRAKKVMELANEHLGEEKLKSIFKSKKNNKDDLILKSFKVTADTLSRTEVDYRDSFIEEWFDEFNRRYFHNKLKDINVSWRSSMEYNGCFKYNVDVFAKTIYPIEIELNKKNINSFDSFRNVLVHEMLHYYVDCYINKPTDEQWMEAVKLKMTKGETEDYLNALDLGTDKCHLGNWQRLANELNSNNKELNITAFGDRDIGLNNSKVDYNNIHLILIKYKNSDTGENAEKFKTYNKERLDEIKKQIKEYKNKPISPREFYFYEIELDRKKLSTSGITELFGNETFNDNFLVYLRKSGVVTKDVTFLGKSNAYKRFSTV